MNRAIAQGAWDVRKDMDARPKLTTKALLDALENELGAEDEDGNPAWKIRQQARRDAMELRGQPDKTQKLQLDGALNVYITRFGTNGHSAPK